MAQEKKPENLPQTILVEDEDYKTILMHNRKEMF